MRTENWLKFDERSAHGFVQTGRNFVSRELYLKVLVGERLVFETRTQFGSRDRIIVVIVNTVVVIRDGAPLKSSEVP